MTLTQLFSDIRTSYIALLAAAAANGNTHVEPAYRDAYGALAVEGSPALPCRADLIAVDGEFAGQSYTVDAKTQLEFAQVIFPLSSTEVRISPFTWDWMPVQVSGLEKETADATLAKWFMSWFDGEDQNQKNADGLYGVVHFMSAVSEEENGLQLSIDLGSVTEAAVEDLLIRLADAKAAAIYLG
ncbi:hypothetical protein [Undibacterium sp. TJN19]|uniref:hypothetical protein n=1 Tax=Undibacterium sp. TJN19 TaxID=3413055 RepID=UPI003BF3B410